VRIARYVNEYKRKERERKTEEDMDGWIKRIENDMKIAIASKKEVGEHYERYMTRVTDLIKLE